MSLFFDQSVAKAISEAAQTIMNYIDQAVSQNIFLSLIRSPHYDKGAGFHPHEKHPTLYEGQWIAPRGSFFEPVLALDNFGPDRREIIHIHLDDGRNIFLLEADEYCLDGEALEAFRWINHSFSPRRRRYGFINQYVSPSFTEPNSLLVEFYHKDDAALFKLMFV
jgi:hypothetical protein